MKYFRNIKRGAVITLYRQNAKGSWQFRGITGVWMDSLDAYNAKWRRRYLRPEVRGTK